MDKKINILIYPAGGENALEVKEALSKKVNINVYGASSKKDHAVYVYKNFFYAPNVNDSNFIRDFNKLLDGFQIDFIIPTHDTVALKLSENSEQLISKPVTSCFDTNLICRHKSLIYNLFRESKFGIKYFSEISEIEQYPCFIKPDVGEGGKNSLIIYSESELIHNLEKFSNHKMLITEYLPGKEFTVDCFTDRFGKLRFVGPRTRERIFGGISVNASTIEDPIFNNIAVEINSKIKFRGYWFYQVKEDHRGQLKIMEVSSRPAGTMALYRQRGINFILLAIYDLLEYDYQIIDNKMNVELDRYLMARYKLDYKFDSIFIDFDDTIVFDNKINPNCLILLYQAKEKKIPVILLTRHKDEIKKSLNKYCISAELFNKIIVVNENMAKEDFIEYNSPIFIDNSFSERLRVYKRFNIPVFDTDNITALIDWKE